MPLHPVAQEMVDDFIASGRPNAHLLPVPVARENFEKLFAEIERPEVAGVADIDIPVGGASIRGRVFTPVQSSEPLPLLVFFHGGGWLLGSIDSHDMMTRKVALATGCVVVSVDYRRGPEARFPTAVNDAYDATVWAVANAASLGADGTRLVVGGDSAGANLATVVAQRARDEDGPAVTHQLLVYPVTTCDLSIGFDMEWEGVMLYRDEMQWHQDNYMNSSDERTHPWVAPLTADLAGLPPATVLLAECDPIRPQGRLYAEALLSAGVPTAIAEYPSLIHGFFGLEMLFPEAQAGMDFAGQSVRDAVGAS
ncbi:MAG: alpha/beta hydrolase [Actinomycetes bacterium]